MPYGWTGFCSYNNVLITYDINKRLATLNERGLDFEDAARVLAGPHLVVEDLRRNYGERRFICYGYLAERLVVIGYVERGEEVHVFSMRKANAREKNRIGSKIAL